MKYPRVVLAATRSGSGKTLLTCALLQALKDRQMKVSAFKCGPDYIDPMFHQKVIGIPSKNLDLFFTDEKKTCELFQLHNESDISVIEGVMGLYDGLGGVSETASTYHLASALDAPIILIVNAHGMGRSILAELTGFLAMDHKHLIKGVILNCISGMFYESIKPVIEEELHIPVLGYYEKQKDINLESRHLGLKLPHEVDNLKSMTQKAAVALEKSVDVEAIINLANEALELPEVEALPKMQNCEVRIGVAMDEAFCFYYEDNLRMLKEKGATIVPFSPVHDEALPSDLDGILLGGGYPELLAKELAENESFKESLKNVIASGMPSLAECGGFMYLHDTMTTEDGISYNMAHVIQGDTFYKGKLVRFGYVTVEDSLFHYKMKGHEFHYFDSNNNGSDCRAIKPLTGRNWECGHIGKNHWWGFAHLYYPSNPQLVDWFINECKTWRMNNEAR